MSLKSDFLIYFIGHGRPFFLPALLFFYPRLLFSRVSESERLFFAGMRIDFIPVGFNHHPIVKETIPWSMETRKISRPGVSEKLVITAFRLRRNEEMTDDVVAQTANKVIRRGTRDQSNQGAKNGIISSGRDVGKRRRQWPAAHAETMLLLTISNVFGSKQRRWWWWWWWWWWW